MRVTYYQDSRVGGRLYNQDRHGISCTRDCTLLVVADGMGGIDKGEIAAQIVVEQLFQRFVNLARPKIDHPNRFLVNTITTAHQAIIEFAANHRLREVPSTTVVAAIIQDDTLYWCHVGDSRLYIFDREGLVLRSRDHSQMQRFIDQGIIGIESIKEHPDRNKIYNCLGSLYDPDVEVGQKMPLIDGMSILLCSDGLWGQFEDEELAKGFKTRDISVVGPVLMNIAEKRGGKKGDNLTAVALTIMDDVLAKQNPLFLDTTTLPDLSAEHGRIAQQLAEEEIVMELDDELNAQIFNKKIQEQRLKK